MSTQQLRAAANGHANGAANGKDRSFPAIIESMKSQIQMALPKHLNADRMVRIALTEFRKNAALAKCDPMSIVSSVVVLSQLGLEPGVLGQAYLVPYGNQCQPIPGWKGLVDLVSRAGRATVHTGAVYEGDLFEFEMGTEPRIKHKPGDSEQSPQTLTHCYAVGWVKGAERPIIEVWSKAKLEKHRDRFNKVGQRHYSFQHFEMYGRKIALLQVLKYLPVSVELQDTAEKLQGAMDLSSIADAGQSIDLQQAASGTWTAPSESDNATGWTEENAIEALRNCTTVQQYGDVFNKLHSAFDGKLPEAVEKAAMDRKAALTQA